RRQQSVDGDSSRRGECVAMSALDFLDQAMTSQQADLSCDAGCLTFGFGGRDVVSAEQQLSQVAVAEAVNGKLPLVHGSQESAIVGTERLESTDASSFPLRRLADFLDDFPQELVMIDRRQG